MSLFCSSNMAPVFELLYWAKMVQTWGIKFMQLLYKIMNICSMPWTESAEYKLNAFFISNFIFGKKKNEQTN